MVMYHKFKPNEETLSLAHTYLRYIEGIQRNGWFDNYKDYDNELTAQNYEVNLEDANGRALWMGTTLAHKKTLPIEIDKGKKMLG
jgi:hypothetical protein